ncbi:ArgE/DapE family deacylase [Nitratireductor sp. ZSWI3]|uniref:ArgE/DapE family deacylase n=1 Tax=Nitratireductor sp. ZSWI3 TaxID=2966359 RepID=UPI0021505835|nr:ArgE/DapE family deacylase [Nitratireductor sp. ZSWI3]MCR4267684.1 ArgE/DapE family deacylase [Nitratireductor sp. ZSWI3]
MHQVDEQLTQKILAAVEQGFEEQIAFTEELIRFPSLRGKEKPAQDFVHQALEARGYAVETFHIEEHKIKDHPGFSPIAVDYSDAVNVVATHEPREARGRSLILNGHMDVVPEGPHDMWEVSPPYEPKRVGDWLYGRGGGDMKAGIAANIFALDALARIGLQPAAKVHVQSVVEEECTGNGALACLVEGYTADAAIIPEPEDEKLVRANCGVLWFEVTVSGHPVHVREAGTGASAIEASYRVIESLKRMTEAWNAEKVNYPYFEDLEHPINFNVGRIEGGDWASSVPAWCKISCRIAIYPGDDPKDRAAQIEAHLARELADDPFLGNRLPEITWNGFFARGYVLEEGSDAEKALAAAHRTATSSELEAFVTPGYLDARVFVIYAGMPCLVYGPITENIHGFDERVSLSSLKRVTGAIALFIADWCGVEPVDPEGKHG